MLSEAKAVIYIYSKTVRLEVMMLNVKKMNLIVVKRIKKKNKN